MTVGMVPMALAFEQGSQMQAQLGLGVIGRLVMPTLTTLLVLSSIFAVVIGGHISFLAGAPLQRSQPIGSNQALESILSHSADIEPTS